MADVVDPRAFAFALSQIGDGFIFEDFCQQFLSQVVGYQFSPAGGIKDREIDALTHVFERKGYSRWLYQASIEQDARSKVFRTADTLRGNAISYDQLHYATNQEIRDKERLIGDFFENFQRPLHLFDKAWFASNVNHSQGTQNAFRVFTAHYLHEYQQPGMAYVVSDLVSDPRLFVFLRQQWESSSGENLKHVLADTLILFALEGTDPDADRFMSKADILKDIATRISFEPASLTDVINARLQFLSTKPRRIRYHPAVDGYCLPYETRIAIQERNLADAALHAAFREHSEEKLKRYLSEVRVQDGIGLLEEVLHRLFYQQGLEFAGFVLKGENKDAIEKNLNEIIAAVVHDKNIVSKNRERVTSALHIALRDMVYNGSSEQKAFLARLSNTYMMLFLLKVDPKICAYFSSMAAELRVYVDNSIIIPALSEYFLSDEHRRHWNLLKRARQAGVQLLVEDQIVDELVSHFKMLKTAYEERYRDAEETYLENEILTLYIEEIMIRAYFYSKRRGQVDTFEGFLDQFVEPTMGPRTKDQLVTWLQEEFGIRFISASEVTPTISDTDVEALYAKLREHKSHDEKARTDAKLVLRIYEERRKNGERGDAGVIGYRTWWLSKDTVTQRAVKEVFGTRYETSCYIRPDFLHNYICLSPSVQEVKDAYRTIFPSLIGVNISYHLPPDVIRLVQARVKEHGAKNRGRLVAVIKDLTDRLKSDAAFGTRKQVTHFLDERLAEVAGGGTA